ncbi:hypothetical protein HDU92_003059 [Lobulomyces angularis]|nr:hypothetical protein HDU92_003059 [Lobulomyces angularis]
MDQIQFKFKLLKPNEKLNFLCQYNNFEPQLQNGPTCGLIVLLIAEKYYIKKKKQNQCPKTLSCILKKSINLNLTKKGEFFFTKNLLDIANIEFKNLFKTRLVTKFNFVEIEKILLNGGAFAIAYDKDGNNEPCFRGGKKAHWCLVIGFIKPVEDSKEFFTSLEINDKSRNYSSKIKQKDYDEKDCYLIALHGKSTNYCVWPYSLLIASNLQLKSVDSKLSSSEFLFPQNGQLDGSDGLAAFGIAFEDL